MRVSYLLTVAAFLVVLHAMTTILIGVRLVHLLPKAHDMIPEFRKIEVTVILIGYNRPESLKRLLASLEKTVVPKESLTVHLKICLDGSDAAAYRVSSSFGTRKKKWYNGNFTLFQRGVNFGLARHIASCWDNPRDSDWALLLEDDVVVSPHIFTAFEDALRVRSQIKYGRTVIQGIAMHGQRVNQYCWTKFVRRHHCPSISEECGTRNATDSILGALMCPDADAYRGQRGEGGWIGAQLPSSWGAFYTGRCWATFQRYFAAWQQLTQAQLTALELPLSMSNEWGASWKRPFAELMHAMGWTLLYRNVDRQRSLITTKRDDGVHVTRNTSAFETEKRCLIVLPSEDNFTHSAGPVDSMLHLDYCSYPVENLQVLQKRGMAFVHRMSRLYNGTGDSHPLGPAVQVLQGALVKSQLSEDVPGSYKPAHATVDRLSAAEVVLVTTTHEVNREFRDFSKQILGQSRVKFVVVGPPKVCSHLRNHEAAHCLPEKQFVGNESRLPVVTKLLQGGLEAAVPSVTQFVGVMNSDIVFEHDSLMTTLTLAKKSESCDGNCVVVGRRHDIDWTTKEKKLHSDWGMDFFIFNMNGVRYAIDNMPPMVVARTRWDSYFMGHFEMSPHMEVIDATETLLANHAMDFSKTRASHTHDDLTNHNLVTEVFQWGRIDYSNHKTTASGVEAHRTSEQVAAEFAVHHEKFKFDLFFEKRTNFTYSPNGLFPFVTCFCALLEKPPDQFCESPTLIGREIKKGADDKSFILPFASLKSFLPLKKEDFFEKIHVTSKSAPPNRCCITKQDLPMISRPRPAKMILDQDYRGSFDIQCLRGLTFPFLSDSQLTAAAHAARQAVDTEKAGKEAREASTLARKEAAEENAGVAAAETKTPFHVVQLANAHAATAFQYQAICLSLFLKLENSSDPDVLRRLKCQFVPSGGDLQFVSNMPRVVQSYENYNNAPFDSYVKQRAWVFTTVRKKDQVEKTRVNLERAGYMNIMYVQDLETVAEREHLVIDNYSEVFGLNSRQRNELVEYMRYWHILRICCGKWMSHKWRMKLQPNGAQGEDFLDVRDPACSNYNIDEVERNFLHSVLYRRITELGLGGAGKIIKVVGQLNGSHCSEYNQLVRSGE